MEVNITEAARLAGVSEKTIRRKLASGQMSSRVSGHAGHAKTIDISELLRVFESLPGHMVDNVQDTCPDMSTHSPDMSGQHGHVLQQVIETQKVLITVLQEQLDARTQESRELRAQVTGLLEWRRPDPAPASQKITRWRSAAVVAGACVLGGTAWSWTNGYRLWFLL